jgi:hypothetical protein
MPEVPQPLRIGRGGAVVDVGTWLDNGPRDQPEPGSRMIVAHPLSRWEVEQILRLGGNRPVFLGGNPSVYPE